MLYVEKIINHKIGNNTPFKDVADSLGWTLTVDEVERAYDGTLWEKGYAPKQPEPTIDEQNEAIRKHRQELYVETSDPLKNAYDEALARGEADADAKRDEWLASKDKIRADNPYIDK